MRICEGWATRGMRQVSRYHTAYVFYFLCHRILPKFLVYTCSRSDSDEIFGILYCNVLYTSGPFSSHFSINEYSACVEADGHNLKPSQWAVSKVARIMVISRTDKIISLGRCSLHDYTTYSHRCTEISPPLNNYPSFCLHNAISYISGFFLRFAPPSSTNSCPLKNPAPITYSTISARSSPRPTLPAGCCLW